MNYLLDENNHDIIVGKRIAKRSGANMLCKLLNAAYLHSSESGLLDRSIGVPWDAVLVKGYSLDVIYHSVRRTIETTKGVREVLSFCQWQ